jgi:hypothetical protein
MITMIKPQNRSAVPPSMRTNVKSLRSTISNRYIQPRASNEWMDYGSKISQLAMTVDAKPNMVMNLKFLCTSQ